MADQHNFSYEALLHYYLERVRNSDQSIVFFIVKSWFSIEKVHILTITHFSETRKDRNLIFGMDGDANVKLCIQHFLSPGLSPTLLGNLF